MSWTDPLYAGQLVTATQEILEDGFMFPGEEWGHASKGDVEIVVYWDAVTKYPTVRFIKSGTATVVSPTEISLVAQRDGQADRIAKQFIEADRLAIGKELPESCSVCKLILNRASL